MQKRTCTHRSTHKEIILVGQLSVVERLYLCLVYQFFCIFPSAWLSLCLSTHVFSLSICLFVCLSISMFIFSYTYIYVFICMCLSIFWAIFSVYLATVLSVPLFLSVCPFIQSLSLCLSCYFPAPFPLLFGSFFALIPHFDPS